MRTPARHRTGVFGQGRLVGGSVREWCRPGLCRRAADPVPGSGALPGEKRTALTRVRGRPSKPCLVRRVPPRWGGTRASQCRCAQPVKRGLAGTESGWGRGGVGGVVVVVVVVDVVVVVVVVGSGAPMLIASPSSSTLVMADW